MSIGNRAGTAQLYLLSEWEHIKGAQSEKGNPSKQIHTLPIRGCDGRRKKDPEDKLEPGAD